MILMCVYIYLHMGKHVYEVNINLKPIQNYGME